MNDATDQRPSRAQTLFWSQMVQLKLNVHYFQGYREETGRFDSAISILLAIASSASIGGWVIWREYAFVWGAIIAVSQVLGAIKEHLPYKRRLKMLDGVANKLEEIFIATEAQWFDISKRKLTEEEIHARYIKIRSQTQKELEKAFGSYVWPEKDHLRKRAADRTDEYFRQFYAWSWKDAGKEA